MIHQSFPALLVGGQHFDTTLEGNLESEIINKKAQKTELWHLNRLQKEQLFIV